MTSPVIHHHLRNNILKNGGEINSSPSIFTFDGASVTPEAFHRLKGELPSE